MIISTCISRLLAEIEGQKLTDPNSIVFFSAFLKEKLDNETELLEHQLEAQKEICLKIMQTKKQIEKSKENIKRLEKDVCLDQLLSSNLQNNLAEMIKDKRLTLDDISDPISMQNICANTSLFEATKEFLQHTKTEEAAVHSKYLKYITANNVTTS